ncbi:fluoride efflux transporter FluC [Kineococcus glutinatus]|uniref:Fluoride-specific ion channel FluC n=1 Tax=Kineococcus glutinatus TaxID=1070872 RepID=A0ABP9HYY6_9ACTN
MPVRPALLVAAGGAAGTAARWGVAALVPVPASGWPLATTLVNLAGAFLLGALLAALPRPGPAAERARLLLGTGFCGAFTTYSALAVEVDLLLREGATAVAVLYPLLSVVGGVGCAAAGAALAGRLPRRGGR